MRERERERETERERKRERERVCERVKAELWSQWGWGVCQLASVSWLVS